MSRRHRNKPIASKPNGALLKPDAAKVKDLLKQCLMQAEAAYKAGGPDAALVHLAAEPMVKPGTRSVMSDADRLALLGRTVSDRDPQTALSLARHATRLDRYCVDGWLLAGFAQDKLGYRQGAALAFAQVVNSSIAQPAQVLQASNMLVRVGDQAVALMAAHSAFDAMGKPLNKASTLLYIAQKTAEWALVDKLTLQLREAYKEGRFAEANESTRSHLNWCADERWNLEVIRCWNQRAFPTVTVQKPSPEPLQGRRLRLGYLSSDFRDHPTSRLANGLFRHHDRSRVELFMYCSGWDDGSAMRWEVTSHFEHIHSVARLNDTDAAELIRSHRIDVLVELNGPTRAHRMGILAHRPAPVQINYLGWPGSVGGRVVDAIVADPYVVPPDKEAHYPEQLIRLRKTYQVND
jgi:predicted O-linked N-acetylglucosamine transferase (SPINDLY family)